MGRRDDPACTQNDGLKRCSLFQQGMRQTTDRKNTVVVNIFGTEYPIRAEADAEYIREVALYVDAKMKEVANSVPLRSTTKVAILAALNVVDELFKERTERETMLERVNARIAELTDVLTKKIAPEHRGG